MYLCGVKQGRSILLILLVFVYTLKPVLPFFEYVLNYRYIVEKLCENRAKPQMHCNGKCHLMKELKKATDEQNPASDSRSTKKVEREMPVHLAEAFLQVLAPTNEQRLQETELSYSYPTAVRSIPTPPPQLG